MTESKSDPSTGIARRLETFRKRIPWWRLANFVGLLVLLAVVLPFVVYAVPQVVGADQSYVVLSGSMEPTISPGDAIIVESVEPSAIEEGDVITFTRDGNAYTTTHRVTEIRDSEAGLEFRTKGDANAQADQAPVAASQVEGRVASIGGVALVIPLVGNVVQFAGTTVGFGVLVVVPFGALVLTEAWNRRSETGARDGAGDAQSGSERGWLTLQPADLKLTLLVTGAFAAYSVWIASIVLSFWTIAVAASTVTAFLLLAGLYTSSGGVR